MVSLGQERQNWFKARWSVKMVRDFLVPLHTFSFPFKLVFHISTESEFGYFDFTEFYGGGSLKFIHLRTILICSMRLHDVSQFWKYHCLRYMILLRFIKLQNLWLQLYWNEIAQILTVWFLSLSSDLNSFPDDARNQRRRVLLHPLHLTRQQSSCAIK